MRARSVPTKRGKPKSQSSPNGDPSNNKKRNLRKRRRPRGH